MKLIKILIVVDSIDIDDSSGAKANIALIRNLQEAGFELCIYHYSRKDISLPNIKCISIKEKKFNIWYLASRLQRIFTRITKININPFIEKQLGFSFTFFNDSRSIKNALLKERNFYPDWVLTLSYASSFRPHKSLLGIPKWHSKWLAYVHDPYPMHSYPRPYDWVEPGHKFKRDFFIKIIKKSKYAIYPSKLLAEWMGSYYPDQRGKEIIIPHQISETETETLESEFPSFFDCSKFNILHAGNMMSARKPFGLIKAFEMFLNEFPEAKENAKLLFIGKQSIFDEYIKKKQLDVSQLFLSDGCLTFTEVKAMQLNASVNVILEAKGPISPFLPGKFPHIINAKLPVLLLGPIYSESKRLLGDNYKYWSEIDDVNCIKNHLKNLYLQWKNNDNNCDYSLIKNYLSVKYLKKVIDNLENK